MTLRDAALRYTEYLLSQIQRAAKFGRWDVVSDLCDRFERAIDNLPPVSRPLVWEGDSA